MDASNDSGVESDFVGSDVEEMDVDLGQDFFVPPAGVHHLTVEEVFQYNAIIRYLILEKWVVLPQNPQEEAEWERDVRLAIRLNQLLKDQGY